MLATSVKDIEEAHRQGKIAALMGIEGGHAIEDSLRLLRRLLRPGRPLHDADPHQHQQLGRFLRRHHAHGRQASQRPHSLRQGRGARDEPAGHDGGHLACLRQDLLGRAGGEQGADLRLAFRCPGAGERAAQYDRRDDRRAGEEGRSGRRSTSIADSCRSDIRDESAAKSTEPWLRA